MLDLKRKIFEVNATRTDALSNRDFGELASCYTKNAAFFPPNAEAVHGRESIATALRDMMETVTRIERRTVETEIEGNLGWETGTYVLLQDDGLVIDQGKYVAIWKRGAKGWLIHRTIFNSSIPVPFID
jgi:ketosteroid isomerase-like protein